MEEEFHGDVCGGNWWNPSRNLFNPSPCSYDVGTFGWLNDDESAVTAVKPGRSISGDSGGGSAASDSSTVIQDPTGNGQVSAVVSTLETMGINLSSSTDAWNQGFINNNPQIKQRLYEDSFVNDFRQMNQPFPEQQPSADSLVTSFPLHSAHNSSLLQMLFDTDFDQPFQNSNLSNNRGWNNSNYSSPSPNYLNLSENLPNITGASPMLENPNSFPIKQPGNNRLQFSNYSNTPFWNASAAVLPSAQPQFRPPSLPATTKPNSGHSNTKRQNKESANSASITKKTSNNEPPQNKRARVENPSPMPAFKVRKEKMGDRITALQQLVSPFGKTDTASVLQEAIEYIKFLHDQVNALSAPYLKNGAAPPLQHQQISADCKFVDKKGVNKDLRSRGLCLVPLSSTFPVASETTSDFWTPNFGGGFR